MAIMENNDTYEYNGTFTIDKGRLREVAGSMLDVFHRHEGLYKELGLLEQNVFRFYDASLRSKNELFFNQALFLATYFDHNKRSDVHYDKDIRRLIELSMKNELHKVLGLEATLFTPHLNGALTQPAFETLDLFGYLGRLDDVHLHRFLHKVVKTYVIGYDKYLERKAIGDNRNLLLDNFRDMLGLMKEEYGNDPAKIFSGVSEEEGYRRMQSLSGMGPHLAFLTTLFFAEAGIVGRRPYELDLPPKVDRHDIAVARVSKSLLVHEEVHKTPVTRVLSRQMREAAVAVGGSPVALDYAFWCTAQLYLHRPEEFQKYAPGRDVFSAKQFREHDRSRYYERGAELADRVVEDTQLSLWKRK